MTCTKAALWVPNTNSLTHANLTRRQTSDITSDVRHQTSVYAASHAQTQPPGAGPAPVQHGCAGSGPAARARGGARRAGARDGGGPVLPQPHAPGLAPPRRQSALPRERHTAARSVVARLESCGGAELTAAVIPPAIHGVVDRHTAGEVEPRADRAERQPARDGDGRRRGARRATAQLARAIVAPAVRSAVRCHAATVARAGPELGERRRTLNEEGLRAHQRPGAAELTGLVVPPAIGLALDREGAGEAVPDGDRAERHVGDHVARRQAELERHRAELPRAVVAPAVGGAVVGERAGVAEPGGECPKVQPARDRDRYWAPGDRSVPEPSARSAAPAVGGPARDHPAGEPTAAAHGGEGMVSLGQDGRGIVAPGAVAELPVGIASPAERRAGSRQAAGVGGKPGSELAEFEERHRDRGGSSLPLARRREHAGARCVPSRDARGRDAGRPRV